MIPNTGLMLNGQRSGWPPFVFYKLIPSVIVIITSFITNVMSSSSRFRRCRFLRRCSRRRDRRRRRRLRRSNFLNRYKLANTQR